MRWLKGGKPSIKAHMVSKPECLVYYPRVRWSKPEHDDLRKRKRNLRLNPKLQPWAHVSLQRKMEMMRRRSLQQPPPMLRRSDREVDQTLTAMAVRALAPAKPTRLWPSHAR